jgi:hypothetical protein
MDLLIRRMLKLRRFGPQSPAPRVQFENFPNHIRNAHTSGLGDHRYVAGEILGSSRKQHFPLDRRSRFFCSSFLAVAGHEGMVPSGVDSCQRRISPDDSPVTTPSRRCSKIEASAACIFRQASQESARTPSWSMRFGLCVRGPRAARGYILCGVSAKNIPSNCVLVWQNLTLPQDKAHLC